MITGADLKLLNKLFSSSSLQNAMIYDVYAMISDLLIQPCLYGMCPLCDTLS